MNELREFIYYNENPYACINLAMWYESLGHISPAISFYLRAAEFSDDKTFQYNCLLKMFLCFEKTPRRWHTCRSLLTRAISLIPERPEAHYLLVRYLQRMNEPSEAYAHAETALNICSFNFPPLPYFVEYVGKWNILFEKAIVSWWDSKPWEARKLFRQLASDHLHEMDESHKETLQSNLSKIGIGPHSQVFVYYNEKDKDRLRINFPGVENIVHNYSQVYQDMFVLSMLNGKQKGTYLEIGSADPKYGNNTYLLETQYDWKGAGIEYAPNLVEVYEQHRKNPVLCKNALDVDYEEILSDLAEDGVVDYLQLDCEPSKVTYEIMLRVPMDKYKFRVITYEHDDYIDIDKKYRKLSREYLRSQGYVMVVGDISPDGESNFEDWWVHPDLVDADILSKMLDDRDVVKKVDKYFLQ